MDVASKGLKSLGQMQKMSDIAEQAKLREAEDPEAPSAEMLAAKEASYRALSVKELRELCKGRPQRPGDADGIVTGGFVEKGDFVAALVADDARRFDALLAAHSAWKAGGCEGPPPIKRKPKPKPAAAAATKAKAEAKAEVKAEAKAETKAAAEGEDDDNMDSEGSEAMAAAMEGSLPVFMSAMVAASLLDVEVTLKEVTKKVLGDFGVDEATRDNRARALRILGAKFIAAKGTTKAARGEVDAKYVLEGTMMKTMAKAQGQEVDDDDDDEVFGRSEAMAKERAAEEATEAADAAEATAKGELPPQSSPASPLDVRLASEERRDKADQEKAVAAKKDAAPAEKPKAASVVQTPAAIGGAAKRPFAKAEAPSADELD